ncbi:tetratricopeptide repeat protein [Salinivibrio sp. PR932]|uniref:tetratricopeptide repeat protein n=2 Tax=unclassified Salinivibrio TaxID=2636825 RepID=UPI00403EA3C4
MTIRKSFYITVWALSCSLISATVLADPILAKIQTRWAQCNYTIESSDDKVACFDRLIDDTQIALLAQPARHDLKIWLAINKSSLAGVDGGMGALGLVKDAKILLEDVITQAPETLDGSALTSLATLYHKVPGWPLAFGDDDKAAELFKKALAINPDGIDSNYFYGEFLADTGKTNLAVAFLKHAQQAPSRSDRPLADQGRQQEIIQKLKELNQQ